MNRRRVRVLAASGCRQQAGTASKRVPEAGGYRQKAGTASKRVPILSPRVCLSYGRITETNPWGKIAEATLGTRPRRVRRLQHGNCRKDDLPVEMRADTDCGHGTRRHRLRTQAHQHNLRAQGAPTKTCRPRARSLQAAHQRGDKLTVGSAYAAAPAAADVETLSSSHAHLGIGRTSWKTIAAAKAMATTVHTLNTPVASR